MVGEILDCDQEKGAQLCHQLIMAIGALPNNILVCTLECLIPCKI